MSTQQLTDWFPADVKPVRVGVYERRKREHAHYSKWSGECWIAYCSTPGHAALESDRSLFQSLEWRGLAADPFPDSADEQTDDHTGICTEVPA